jgi:phage terminase Nu1 subunit (DNA packaging protein)
MAEETKQIAIVDLCESTLGITDRRYRAMAKQGIVPRVAKGKVPSLEAIRAVIKYYRNRSKAGWSSAAFEDARAVAAQHKAALLELELHERKGRLIDAEKVKAAAFAQGRMVCDKLLNIPDRVAPIIAAETDQTKVAELLTREIRQALEELSK